MTMIVGMTGGMACGKTTAAEIFRGEGCGAVDTDELVRELLAQDTRTVTRVKERFGDAVTSRDGSVDRRALARIVFGSPSELEWLEGILHPEVDRLWRERVGSAPERTWVVQVPLLFEKQLQANFDFTVCVAASPAVQRERIRQRGISDEEAEARLARQLDLEKKMALSDIVILNDGSLSFLREQVFRVLREMDSQKVIA